MSEETLDDFLIKRYNRLQAEIRELEHIKGNLQELQRLKPEIERELHLQKVIDSIEKFVKCYGITVNSEKTIEEIINAYKE